MNKAQAARFGGVPDDYGQVFDALFLLMHGAASLIAVAPRSCANKEAEVVCIAISDQLLNKKIEIFREDANKRGTGKESAGEAAQ